MLMEKVHWYRGMEVDGVLLVCLYQARFTPSQLYHICVLASKAHWRWETTTPSTTMISKHILWKITSLQSLPTTNAFLPTDEPSPGLDFVHSYTAAPVSVLTPMPISRKCPTIFSKHKTPTYQSSEYDTAKHLTSSSILCTSC